MKYFRSSKGFTLLEMLIVLSVVSIILLFSIFTYQSFSDMIQKKLFITQLEADLYYAHAYAVNRREKVQVQFSPIKKEYKVTDLHSSETLLQRSFPSTIYIQESNIASFVINADGNVSNFGTIIFRQNQHAIKLKFYIGKGRFIIEE
ncbi:competence protein ComGD [Lederbergia ruris]|uniref:Competence protein ComGD n=1 Tax=Lederbergia ruris TaxID=217495 RepID=A0ABQ4KE97_9BACI|nr:competence type IV pilus minor pilin ComGD [Lederbergia ruris]GIN55769.1 competence protein ComGD [Lederbergia ruris]